MAHETEGSKLTKLDTTVGTVAYMSPEQAQGMEVDHRTDLWALGCVTYEMLRGQRPFQGVYDQALVYEIVNQEPEPLTGVRTGVPMELEWMVGKCLAKDREDRYNHAEDMMLDLRTLAEKLKSGGSTVLRTGVAVGASVAVSDAGARHVAPVQGSAEVGVQPGVASQQTAGPVVASGEMVPKRKLRLQQALFAVTALALLAVSFLYFRQTAPEAPLRRFGFTPPVAINVAAWEEHPNLGISPNGRHIVFTAQDERRLWIHDLDRGDSRPLEGTEGANDPFWSPGSDFVAYFAGAQIRTISARGGVPIRVYQRPGGFSDRGGDNRLEGGTWSPDGNSIVFSEDGRLYEIPARGGTPKLLVSPEESEQSSAEPSGGPRGLIHLGWPHFMPSEAGARVLVYTFGSSGSLAGALGRQRSMMVHDLESGRREILGPGQLPFYSPSGHLLYQAGPMTYDHCCPEDGF